MSEQARKYPESATITQRPRISPAFFMAPPEDLTKVARYEIETVVDFRGRTYLRDPGHEHDDHADAYALVMKHGKPFWRGYSDGWEAIREMDAIQSYVLETGGIAECAPVAVVDRDGRARWIAH